MVAVCVNTVSGVIDLRSILGIVKNCVKIRNADTHCGSELDAF